MDKSYIQLNIVNIITITIMAAVGMSIIGFAGTQIAKYKNGNS